MSESSFNDASPTNLHVVTKRKTDYVHTVIIRFISLSHLPSLVVSKQCHLPARYVICHTHTDLLPITRHTCASGIKVVYHRATCLSAAASKCHQHSRLYTDLLNMTTLTARPPSRRCIVIDRVCSLAT